MTRPFVAGWLDSFGRWCSDRMVERGRGLLLGSAEAGLEFDQIRFVAFLSYWVWNSGDFEGLKCPICHVRERGIVGIFHFCVSIWFEAELNAKIAIAFFVLALDRSLNLNWSKLDWVWNRLFICIPDLTLSKWRNTTVDERKIKTAEMCYERVSMNTV